MRTFTRILALTAALGLMAGGGVAIRRRLAR